MTTPKYLELFLEHTEDGDDTAVFGCPVAPCPHRLKVTVPGLTRSYSPVLRLGDDLDEIDHPDPAVQEALADAEAGMLSHVEHQHDWSAWLIAAQINDDTWEEHLNAAHAETDRAWSNARSSQQSLLEAREEIAELLLTNSATRGALAAVQQLVEGFTGEAITATNVAVWRSAILQVIGRHDDPVSFEALFLRVQQQEQARTAILRYLDLFDDTADGLRRTVQAFLGQMPHEHDRTASAVEHLRETVSAMRFTVATPAGAGRLWEAAKGLLEQLDRVHAPVYYCPTSGQKESPCCGGFDDCCDQPELHRPATSPEENTHGDAH